MRRVLLIALTTAGLASLTGCPSKPKSGECKSSQDCLEQQGFGKVCVEGRCQECAADSDCKEGFVCRENKCAPKPQCAKDADCPEGQRCEADRCVPRRDEAAEAARRKAEEDRQKGAVPPECADTAAFTIRFGFDQAGLGADSQGTLQKLADCVKRAPTKKITVSGHADERGTTQYNIALGARRAESARKYLSDLGVATKLDTVSFGKEKPVCSDSTEECWARNRRDEFQVDR
ncbi:MAG TPA: OmpA family protein [Anaeromyxobacter sp.]